MKSIELLKDPSKLIEFKLLIKQRFNLPNSIDGFKDRSMYIWGMGALGKFAIKELEKMDIDIRGILTSEKDKLGGEMLGIPVVSVDEVDNDAIIVVCSISYPIIFEKIEGLGYKNYIYYETLPFLYDDFMYYYMAFDNGLNVLCKNIDILEKSCLLLSDKMSTEILDNILMYRISMDNHYLDRAYIYSIERGEQYFDRDIVRLNDNEVFVDCGGYIGDTTEDFIKNCHNKFKKIYFFEPDKKQMEAAQINLKNYEKIEYNTKAVGKTSGYAYFDNTSKGGSGRILNKDDENYCRIEIASIDESVLDECPTYIKMDVEGSEMEALEGAINIIKKNRPKMAISIYHHPEDIFKIINYIDVLALDYQFFIRHYTRTYADTVLYCIP